MRKSLLLIIAIAINVVAFSQQRITSKEIDIFQKNLKASSLLKDDADFSIAGTEKWPNESAVILCQKTSFDFDKQGVSAGKRIGRNLLGLLFAPVTMGTSIYFANAKNELKILVEETERRKILLRDKYAVEQYSVLYFRLSAEGDAFAARVIKKDGSVQPVSIEDAVRVDDIKSVPSTFRSYTDERYTITYRPDYFKVPIGDLEEGDIIEYEFKNYNTQEYTQGPNYKEFNPVYYICNREMPVAKQIIEVVSEDSRYYIGYKSLKGAPEFSETSAGGNKVYRWVDENRDKLVDTRYINEFVEQPSVKFQVIYAKGSSKSYVWFNDQEAMKRDMTNEELTENIKKYWFNNSKYGDENVGDMVNAIYKSLKKKGITDGLEDDYIKKAYYTIRARTLYDNWNDVTFAKVFSGLLNKKDIKHEILATTSNQRTQLSKIAFTKEVAWVIKCKNKYYCNPYEHLNPEEIPVYLAGNSAIRFAYDDEKNATPDVIPATDTAANVLATQITATLDTSRTNITVNKIVEAKGMAKDDIIDDILAYTPFMENDFRNFDGGSMWEGLSDNEMTKAMENFSKQKQEWKEEKPKIMEAMAEDEYDAKVEKYINFRLQQDARSFKKRSLRYNEDFILSGLTAVAGNDIVVSIPSLVGSQPKITKEERNRTLPVDLRYPRKLLWHIVMPVPDGYTVKGLDNLNKKIENTCGSFVTTAVVDGNNLVIDVRKIYNGAHYENAQWNQVLDIVDAAYNFSQAKIVLKKN